MSNSQKIPKSIEVCILAGGLSSRMGREKSRMRLGGKSLLTHVKSAAEALQLPVRIIRKDLVSRCGPLGGIYTALKTTLAQSVLFLPCDMPLVSGTLIQRLLDLEPFKFRGAFVFHNGSAGFPFVIRTEALPQVQSLLASRRYSLQELARRLKARMLRPGRHEAACLLNINTPEDWAIARRLWRERRGTS